MGLAKAGKKIASIVFHRAGLAVHQPGCTHHVATERGPDRLVAQANTEDGHLTGKVANEWDADPGFLGGARSRRKHNTVRRFRVVDLFHRQGRRYGE